jgi:hypothetical protein
MVARAMARAPRAPQVLGRVADTVGPRLESYGRARRAPLVVFVAALGLYLATLYPGVGGRFQYGDGAKWQFLPSVLGISHPPGSPLYVLVGWLFAKIPLFGSIAKRAMLLSALAGAGTVAYVYAAARRILKAAVPALLAAVMIGTSEALWTFSTEAEVYAPMALAFAFVVHRLVVWSETRRLFDFGLLCVVYALSFGVHLMALTLLPAIVVFVFRTDRRMALRPTSLLTALFSIALGLLPYAWLWTRIPHAPYSEFIGARTWPAFVDFVLGRNFRTSMFHLSTRAFWYERSGWALGVLAAQTSVLGLVGIFAGGARAWARDSKLGEMLVFAMLGPLVFLAGFPDGDERGGVLPVLVSGSILLATAYDHARSRTSQGGWGKMPMVTIAAFVAVGLPGSWTGMHLAIYRPVANTTRDLDSKGYPWDLECIVESADERATIVVPWGDYGVRQIVNYYKYADPRVAEKKLGFQFFEDPWDASPSSPPRWHPTGAEPGPVYVFTKNHKEEIEKYGFLVEQRPLTALGKCAKAYGGHIFYVGRTSS